MTWGDLPLSDISYFPIQNPTPDYGYKSIDLTLTQRLKIVGMVGIKREVLAGEYELRGNGTSVIKIYFPNMPFPLDDGVWILFSPEPEIYPTLTEVKISNKTIPWSYTFTQPQVDSINNVYLCPSSLASRKIQLHS